MNDAYNASPESMENAFLNFYKKAKGHRKVLALGGMLELGYFNLNLVYMYTNISFTDKQREDEFKIYDCLKSNGFFEAFFEALEDSEYNELFDQLNEIKEASTASRQSAAAILNRFIDDLPKQAAAAQNIVDNFNPEKYKEVIKFANFANGGRDFRTNQPVTK